jgi:ABC-type glutathione transport system ATPase component
VVTHALQYVSKFDDIFLLDQGEVVARGGYEFITTTDQYKEYISENEAKKKEAKKKEAQESMKTIPSEKHIGSKKHIGEKKEVPFAEVNVEIAQGMKMGDMDGFSVASERKSEIVIPDPPAFSSKRFLRGKGMLNFNINILSPTKAEPPRPEPSWSETYKPLALLTIKGIVRSGSSASKIGLPELEDLQQLLAEDQIRSSKRSMHVPSSHLNIENDEQLIKSQRNVSQRNKESAKVTEDRGNKDKGSLTKKEFQAKGLVPIHIVKWWVVLGG